MAEFFSNATIITPEGAVEGAFLRSENGIITEVAKGVPEPGPEDILHDCSGGFLLPGFVDLHCHGGNGCEFTGGVYDAEAEEFVTSEKVRREAPLRISSAHLQHGTTTQLLATCAAPAKQIEAVCRDYRKALEEGGIPSHIEGIYLEGTFLKEQAFAGAQDAGNFLQPSLDVFNRLNDASCGAIRVVTLAPEWGAGVPSFVRGLVERGVIPASGHTAARFAQMQQALEAGVCLATHFSNGPMFTTFKPPGGAMEAMIQDENVVLEVICDGYHINPHYVMDFINGRHDRTALITDAMAPVGREDIKSFVVGGKRGVLSDDGGVLRLAGTEFTLFGSILTMDRAVANLAGWLTDNLPGIYSGPPQHEPPGWAEALVEVSRMASGIPARLLGLRDRGAIAEGLNADLVLMDGELKVRQVFVGGQKV